MPQNVAVQKKKAFNSKQARAKGEAIDNNEMTEKKN